MAQKLVLVSLNGDIVEEAKAAIKKEFPTRGAPTAVIARPGTTEEGWVPAALGSPPLVGNFRIVQTDDWEQHIPEGSFGLLY